MLTEAHSTLYLWNPTQGRCPVWLWRLQKPTQILATLEIIRAANFNHCFLSGCNGLSSRLCLYPIIDLAANEIKEAAAKLSSINANLKRKYSQVHNSHKVRLAVSQHGATFLINEFCLTAVFGLRGQKTSPDCWTSSLGKSPKPMFCSSRLGLKTALDLRGLPVLFSLIISLPFRDALCCF